VFRGIVEGTGRVVRRAKAPLGERLLLELPVARELELGQSVAVDGACLTVVAVDRRARRVAFDLAGETLRRTSLGRLEVGDRVNFERAMRLEDRIDGHLVQGHVDGTGVVRSFDRRGDDRWLEVAAPRELLARMVEKGSVAVAGVSLTIAALARDRFACTIVPHTLAVTSLGDRRPGDRVSVECDVMMNWTERLLQSGAAAVSRRARAGAARRSRRG
jgi:riboflavin synthase alpha subunit